MRKILTILLLAVSLTSWGTRVYVATTGNDGTGDGTVGAPYLTIATGITNASAGDTVYVVAGTYSITAEVSVPVGISIMGAGSATTIINSTYRSAAFSSGFNNGTFLLSSVSQGTAGNQSISHLTFDGGDGDASGSTNAIMIKNRGAVLVHDCIIRDFDWTGVTFTNGTTLTAPTTYAYGNKLYNCTITNCSGQAGTWEGCGLVSVNGQDNLDIYNCIFYGDQRAEGDNGDIIASHGQGFNKRLQYHNNISYKPDYDGAAWNFHLELFNCYGGSNIYDNEFHGGDCQIDITGMYGNTKTDQAYTYRIYNNLFTGVPVETDHGKPTIDIEGDLNEDIYIYNNHFLNLPVPISTTDNTYAPSQTRRIYIYYNIFENMGWNDAAKYETCININNWNAGSVMDNIHIYNNVMESDGVTHTAAFKIAGASTISNLMIKNNIITGHTNGAYMLIDNDGTIDSLHIVNNLIYGSSNSNNVLWQTVGDTTNVINTGAIKSDPLFKSSTDLHLQPTSPARDAGIDVSAITGGLDYHGASLYGAAYDIGAFEYGVGRMINIGTMIPTINYKIVLIDH